MAQTLVRISNMTLVRGLRVLIQGMDFELKSGEIWALTGANGAGKTTLLRAMAGLHRPFAGAVTHEGAGLSFLGHELALKPWDLPRQVLSKQSLETWDLEDLADLPIRYLSAGQKKRVALALRCLADRQVWLFDEPFSNLDSQVREKLRDTLNAHAASGGSVLCSVHGKELDAPQLRIHEGRVVGP